MSLGRPEPAATAYRRALAIYDEHGSASQIAVLRSNLGAALAAAGDYAGSLERYAEARTMAERAISAIERTTPEHPYLGHALLLLGSAAVHGGDADAAVIATERVRAMCERGVALESEVCTEARYVLARALFERPESRARARALAEQAQRELRAGNHATPALAREVDEWLESLEPDH